MTKRKKSFNKRSQKQKEVFAHMRRMQQLKRAAQGGLKLQLQLDTQASCSGTISTSVQEVEANRQLDIDSLENIEHVEEEERQVRVSHCKSASKDAGRLNVAVSVGTINQDSNAPSSCLTIPTLPAKLPISFLLPPTYVQANRLNENTTNDSTIGTVDWDKIISGQVNPATAPSSTSRLFTITGDVDAFNQYPSQDFCLLCCEKTDDPRNACGSISGKNFQVIFVLKKMLNIPTPRLIDYVQVFGDPGNWINFCQGCQTLVDEAMMIQKEIGRLEVNLRQCQNVMKARIKHNWKKKHEMRVKESKSASSLISFETRSFVCLESKAEKVNKVSEKLSQKKKERLSRLDQTTYRNPDALPNGDAQLRKEGVVPVSNTAIEVVTNLNHNIGKNSSESCITLINLDHGSHENEMLDHSLESQDDEDQSESILMNRNTAENPVDIDMEIQALNAGGYSCLLCPKEGEMPLRAFISHIMFHYKRPLRCSTCGLYFASTSELESNPFSNEKSIKSRDHLCSKDALVPIVFENGNVWSCSVCSEKFKLDSARDEHEKMYHHTNIVQVNLNQRCLTCSKPFRSLSECLLHRALKHPEVADTSCYYCDEIFKKPTKEGIDICDTNELTTHLSNYHKSFKYVKTPTNCDFCGAIFWTTSGLCQHMTEAHGLKHDMAYSCNVCYARRSRPTKVQKHVSSAHVISSNRKYNMFVCETCGHTVTRVDWKNSRTLPPIQFEDHKLSKHGIQPESGRRVYACPKERCKFQTLISKNLSIHKLKVHEEMREIVCQVCGKGFLKSEQLRRHQEIHLNANLKPFQCEICGNSFAVKNYLYIHMRLSHQNRPFASTNKKKASTRNLKTLPAGEASTTASEVPKNLSQRKGGKRKQTPQPQTTMTTALDDASQSTYQQL